MFEFKRIATASTPQHCEFHNNLAMSYTIMLCNTPDHVMNSFPKWAAAFLVDWPLSLSEKHSAMRLFFVYLSAIDHCHHGSLQKSMQHMVVCWSSNPCISESTLIIQPLSFLRASPLLNYPQSKYIVSAAWSTPGISIASIPQFGPCNAFMCNNSNIKQSNTIRLFDLEALHASDCLQSSL